MSFRFKPITTNAKPAMPPKPKPEVALANKIVETAMEFNGLKEIRPNREWDDPSTPGPDTEKVSKLKRLMRPAPWENGWAYCAAFGEGVVVEALRVLGHDPTPFAKVMGPHVMTAYNAFNKLGLIRDTPAVGALCFCQHGTGSSGHLWIVRSLSAPAGYAKSIEANTSANKTGNQREGDWITTKTRKTSGSEGSLRVRGYLWPVDILALRSE